MDYVLPVARISVRRRFKISVSCITLHTHVCVQELTYNVYVVLTLINTLLQYVCKHCIHRSIILPGGTHRNKTVLSIISIRLSFTRDTHIL
jgi:hypothetical protein